MLASSTLQALICTTKPDVAKAFYRDTLGLRFVRDDEYAAVFELSGGALRLSRVTSLTPSEHAVLGFAVNDIESAVAGLRAKGVEMERFAAFKQDEHGVWTSPAGTRVAFFRDPDGNMLSVAQIA